MPWGVAAAAAGTIATSYLTKPSKSQQQSQQESFGGPLINAQRVKGADLLFNQLTGQPTSDLNLGASTRFRELPYRPITETPLNSMGLYEGQQQGFNEAITQALGKLSGNFADRGFNTPRAINALAGSAAQNVMPQFAPLIGSQIAEQDQFRQQLSLAPIEARAKQNADYLSFLQTLIASMGGSGSGTGAGSSSTPGASSNYFGGGPQRTQTPSRTTGAERTNFFG